MNRDLVHKRTQDRTTFMLNDYVLSCAIELKIDQYIFDYVYKDRIIQREIIPDFINRELEDDR